MKITLTTVLTTLLAVASAKPLCKHQAHNQTAAVNGKGNHNHSQATLHHIGGLGGHHHHAVRAGSSGPGHFAGKMTYYDPGQGACGGTNGPGDMIVAVSSSVYGAYPNPNNSPACQRTATIHCGGGRTVKAAVRDRCDGCGAGDVDVSPAVFTQCAGDLGLGVVMVTWDFQ